MSDKPFEIGIVGVGKIAKDQHIPVLQGDPDFRLTACVTRYEPPADIPVYASVEAMLAAHPTIDAVVLSNTPQQRFATAVPALRAKKHLLLEKPPGSTLAEVQILVDLAETAGVVLFATWHSRFSPGVAMAREWLSSRKIKSVRIDWREDVRHWHAGQEWIWEPGGMGVFDPGINALSVATEVLPEPFFLQTATLDFPSNRQAPIAAELTFETLAGVPIEMGLDWLQTGPQTWNVSVQTDDGECLLTEGGAKLTLPGRGLVAEPDPKIGGVREEYLGLYRRFAELLRSGRSDVDVSPLRHAADAFMRGRRVEVAPFED